MLSTASCKHILVLLRMGEIFARIMLSWLKLLIKLSLLHLVGCLCYLSMMHGHTNIKSVTDSLHLCHSNFPFCADLPTNNSIPPSSHSRTYISHFRSHGPFNTTNHAILEAQISSNPQFLTKRAEIRLQNNGGNYQSYANHNNSYFSPDVIFDYNVHTDGIVIVS